MVETTREMRHTDPDLLKLIFDVFWKQMLLGNK